MHLLKTDFGMRAQEYALFLSDLAITSHRRPYIVCTIYHTIEMVHTLARSFGHGVCAERHGRKKTKKNSSRQKQK